MGDDMALIDCPDCQNPVSDQAPACLHCGYPFEPRSSRKRRRNNHSTSDSAFVDPSESSEPTGPRCPLCGHALLIKKVSGIVSRGRGSGQYEGSSYSSSSGHEGYSHVVGVNHASTDLARMLDKPLKTPNLTGALTLLGF